MKNIVVIDDEESLCIIIEVLLKKLNFVGHSFTNGLEALEHIKENLPDAVLVDIAMPEINGIEIISKIREISSDIPIIAMSGMEWKDTLLASALISGANKILKKPFNFDELSNVIMEIF